LFLHLKKHLAGERFDDDDEVQEEEVMTWFKGHIKFYSGDHIEKNEMDRARGTYRGQGRCIQDFGGGI
jgi:hypothetical protein